MKGLSEVSYLAALMFLVLLVLFIGQALHGAFETYESGEPTITVESVEFNEDCLPTHMFVVDMKGHPLRVFDCSE